MRAPPPRLARLLKRLHWWLVGRVLSVGLGRSLERMRPGGRVLIYHGVDESGSRAYNTRFIADGELETHLAWLAAECRVVDLATYATGERAPDRLTVALTFDDGYANNLQRVLPLLEKHDLPATFYVTGAAARGRSILWPDLVDLAVLAVEGEVEVAGRRYRRHRRFGLVDVAGGETLKGRCLTGGVELVRQVERDLDPVFEQIDLAQRERLADYWRQMTEAELGELNASPLVTLGSHGYDHVCLGLVDSTEARADLEESRDFLERLTGGPVRDLAFPAGSYSRSVVEIAAELGFDRQGAVDLLHAEDAGDRRLIARLGHNPLLSWPVQRWCFLKGRY